MKTGFKIIGTILLLIVISYFFATFTGLIDLQFNKFFGMQQANVSREIFNQNKTQVEGKTTRLAKAYYEYNQETDPAAKKAILQLIREEFANFDLDLITNPSLRAFAQKAIGGL